jgi:hypothetical protein
MFTMKIISFNYTKISVEKNSSNYKDLKIGTSVNIVSIEEPKNVSSSIKDSFVVVNWNYGITYNPGIANINFSGSMVLSMEPKEAKEVLKNWKDKKMDSDFNILLVNAIMKKTNIKALQFEEEFNLPTHFKLPSVKINKKE